MKITNPWLKPFKSVKLTVSLLFLLLIPCIIGTLIPQNDPPESYLARYGPLLDRIFRLVGFYDLFHTPWFRLILLLLFLNTTVCLLDRFRFSPRALGSFLTHLSVVVIILGAIVGNIFGEGGFMKIYEGHSEDSFFTQGGKGKGKLPFTLSLEDFEVQRRTTPSTRLLVYYPQTGQEKSFTWQEGKSYPLMQGRASLKVTRYLPNALATTKVVEGSQEPVNPAIFLHIISQDKPPQESYLFAKDKKSFAVEGGLLSLSYRWLENEEALMEEVQRARAEAPDKPCLLKVSIKDGPEEQTFPVQEGSEVAIGSYEIKVLQVIPDFIIDSDTKEVKSRSEQFNNPAMKVMVKGPSGEDVRWLFSKFPEFDKFQKKINEELELAYRHEDVVGSFQWEVILTDGPALKKTIVFIKDNQVVKKIPWTLGLEYPIDGTGYVIKPEKFFADATLMPEVINASDEPKNPALEVELHDAEGLKEKFWLMANSPADLGAFRLLLSVQYPIKDFKSTLKVLEDGQGVLTKTIEVNDPLEYKGYVFYQSSYDEEGEQWSGLQVKQDPGVPLVYAGFLLLTLGLTYGFYIMPIMYQKGG